MAAVREENLVPGITRRRWLIRRIGLRRAVVVTAVVTAVVAAVLAGVSGCGSAGRASPGASPAASGSVSAYLDCLSQHSGSGARTACKPLRPAAGALAAAARTFTGCLRSHGVAVPAASPGTRAGGALQSVLSLRSGSPQQRSAFRSCRSALPSGKGG